MLDVIPGLTSIQVLCAAHAIPLNELGASVMITTGRQLRDGGWPDGPGTVVVMLDAGGAFTSLYMPHYHIWWGAYVGMQNEICIEGPLADVAEQIQTVRAQAKAAHGWIMDIYILRRIPTTPV